MPGTRAVDRLGIAMALLLLGATAVNRAHAQADPSKDLQFISPGNPGSAFDIMPHLIAEEPARPNIQRRWRQIWT